MKTEKVVERTLSVKCTRENPRFFYSPSPFYSSFLPPPIDASAWNCVVHVNVGQHWNFFSFLFSPRIELVLCTNANTMSIFDSYFCPAFRLKRKYVEKKKEERKKKRKKSNRYFSISRTKSVSFTIRRDLAEFSWSAILSAFPFHVETRLTKAFVYDLWPDTVEHDHIVIPQWSFREFWRGSSRIRYLWRG